MYEKNRKQQEVINSKEKYICVSATAGSGKTHTLVERLKKILKNKKENRKILVISFTRAAANEIKNRIKNQSNERVEVRTFDSLFQKLFFNFQHLSTKIYLDKENINITFPRPEERLVDAKEWKKRLFEKKDLYTNEVYKEALIKLLFNSEVKDTNNLSTSFKIINYLNSTYCEIMVDEAQDMDKYQIRFVKNLYEKTCMKIILFRDYSQSIFGFRGARPDLLRKFENDNNFKEYHLDKGFRCKEDIYDLANNFRLENNKLSEFEHLKNLLVNWESENISVFINRENSVLNAQRDLIESLNGRYLNSAFIISQHKQNTKIKNSGLFENYRNSTWPVKNIKLDIEDLILIYFNNDINLFFSKYDLDYDQGKSKIYSKVIYPYYLSDNNKNKDDLYKFLVLIFTKFEKEDIIEIEGQINNIIFKFDELKDWALNNNRRITTYFSVKGLEYDLVYLYLNIYEMEKLFNDDWAKLMSWLFVAITRAKNRLVIFLIDNNHWE